MSITTRIHGPLISSSDLDAHAALAETFGMTPVARQCYADADVKARWGIDCASAEEAAFMTPGTKFGATFVRFSPLSPTIIRTRDAGYHADAPKVVDFYVPDFAAARASLEARGWPLKSEIAEYDLPEGRFIEGHLWGPDEIVFALISGPKDFFANMASVTNAMFSEPQSLSGPVSDRPPVIRFFEEVFELRVVYRYGIEDDSFKDLVGTQAKTFNLTAVNVGLSTREPYFGLIHYGMPKGSYQSLYDVCRPPNRGILGATIEAADTDEIARRALAISEHAVLAAPIDADLAGFGRVRTALIKAPNGGCYRVIQRLA